MSDSPLYRLSTTITFLPTDMLLQRASGYLIAWSSEQWVSELARDTQKTWLKEFFFEKFQAHFTPVKQYDVQQLSLLDLRFKYKGDGYFIPRSQQGLIATEDHYDVEIPDPPVTTITFLFDVESDGKSMHTLHITYEGRDEYKLMERATTCARMDPHWDK